MVGWWVYPGCGRVYPARSGVYPPWYARHIHRVVYLSHPAYTQGGIPLSPPGIPLTLGLYLSHTRFITVIPGLFLVIRVYMGIYVGYGRLFPGYSMVIPVIPGLFLFNPGHNPHVNSLNLSGWLFPVILTVSHFPVSFSPFLFFLSKPALNQG